MRQAGEGWSAAIDRQAGPEIVVREHLELRPRARLPRNPSARADALGPLHEPGQIDLLVVFRCNLGLFEVEADGMMMRQLAPAARFRS
jgi:hypothetical protein